jgi:hypothetical protein
MIPSNKIKEQIFDMIIAYKNSNRKSVLKKQFNTLLAEQIPKTLSKSDLNKLNFRREKRGFFDFFLYVYEKTEKESRIIQEWKKSLENNGYTIDVINTGIDNNGLPILENSKELKNSDFIVYINGEKHVLDLKISPVIKCFTFKLCDLEKYLKNGVRILLILSEDFDPKFWSILDEKFMKMMLDNKVGERFRHFGGFKETQRIYKNTTKKYIGYEDLVKKKLMFLEEFKNV